VILAAVKAHGAGKGLPEIKIEARTDPKVIRNAPNYMTASGSEVVDHPLALGNLKFEMMAVPGGRLIHA
jgi:hypothetical protein